MKVSQQQASGLLEADVVDLDEIPKNNFWLVMPS